MRALCVIAARWRLPSGFLTILIGLTYQAPHEKCSQQSAPRMDLAIWSEQENRGTQAATVGVPSALTSTPVFVLCPLRNIGSSSLMSISYSSSASRSWFRSPMPVSSS